MDAVGKSLYAYESLDYDEAEKDFIYARAELTPDARRSFQLRTHALTWLLNLLVGVIVGCIAFFTTSVIRWCTAAKFSAVDWFWDAGDFGLGWLMLMGITSVCAVIAMLLTAWAPEAAGSGIPQVKAYLNGNKIPGVLDVKTLVAKVVGICVCVAMGLPTGREGPMVHAAAIAANSIASFLSIFLRNRYWRGGRAFDNDYDRRNFVSMGAAAGVAVAFHAPIGGIFFSLEEVLRPQPTLPPPALLAHARIPTLACPRLPSHALGQPPGQVSSFWDPHLTWNTFICAATSAFTVGALEQRVGAGAATSALLIGWKTTEEWCDVLGLSRCLPPPPPPPPSPLRWRRARPTSTSRRWRRARPGWSESAARPPWPR